MPYTPQPPGLGQVGAYQVSGKPFVSGNIDLSVYTEGPIEINFPSVTRWIIVRNRGVSADNSKIIKVAGSANGFITGEYFRVSDDYNGSGARRNATTPRMELKMTKIYLTGSSDKVDVIAGLTGVPTESIRDNWSGSAGIG
jgi:hypothetical protein|tara:strand:+ start:853 stop:1275 length:423 start_codon:yes stop_codon:yes gene_type:complete